MTEDYPFPQSALASTEAIGCGAFLSWVESSCARILRGQELPKARKQSSPTRKANLDQALALAEQQLSTAQLKAELAKLGVSLATYYRHR